MAASGVLSLKEVYAVLEGHAGDVNSTAWSPTNKELFCSCCGDKHIRVWKIKGPSSPDKKLAPVETVLAHKFYINSCAYNPSGDLFATTSSDDTIKLWSTASWTCVGELGTGEYGGVVNGMGVWFQQIVWEREAGCYVDVLKFVCLVLNESSE